MTQTFVPVGTVTRLGKRADGQRWHYAKFKEDGTVDLPPGTELFVIVDPHKINRKTGTKDGRYDNQSTRQVLPETAG